MDYIPIQATSVPCEHAFSSSAETDTNWRNRIGPIIMECLQLLKFVIKKDRLNFTNELLTPEYDMLASKDPSDMLLLTLLFTGNEEEAMDQEFEAVGRYDISDT
jgi:hypothetical protein